MVPNTSELLPDPETPVNAVNRRLGISTLTSLRLFTRAPCTRIRSWLSAACSAGAAFAVVALLMVFSDDRGSGRNDERRPARAGATGGTSTGRGQRTSLMRIMLPAGSRTAQSRTP